MIVKNAFKILTNKFGLVWTLAIYTLGLTLITVSMTLPLFIVLRNALLRSGINDELYTLYQGVLNGNNIGTIFDEGRLIYSDIINLFKTDKNLIVGSRLYFVFGIMIVMRFLLGLYELPMLTVLDGNMSSNAKIGFMGSFISNLIKSSRFVLSKMIFTIAFDILMYSVVFLMWGLFKVPVLSVFTPFLIAAVVILILAFRYTLVAMWSPSIICGGLNEIKGFMFSVKQSFKHFKSIFSVFIVTWIFAITLNLFVGLFTFGAGLLISVPSTMLLFCILNMTIYYTKNGKRFYVDGVVVTPPTAEIAE